MIIEAIFIVLFTVFLIKYLNYYKKLSKWKKYYTVTREQFLNQLPIKIPLINPYGIEDGIQEELRLSKKHAMVAKCTGNLFRLVILDRKIAHECFVVKKNNFTKPIELYKVLQHEYGSNIVISNGDDWKNHRRFAEPAFTKDKLSYLAEVTHKTTNEMLDFVKRETDNYKKPFDICEHSARLTISIIATAAWGRNLDMFAEKPPTLENGHQFSLYEAAHIDSTTGVFYQYLVPDIVDTILKKLPFKNIGQHFQRVHDEMFGYLTEFWKERKEDIEQGKDVPDDLMSFFIKGRSADGKPLTKNQIISNEHILLIAGHETSSTAMGFILYELARKPELQEAIFKTLDQFDHEPNLEDYIQGRLTLLKNCMKEGLRLYPPVVHIPKRATKTVKVTDVNGKEHKIHKGHMANVNVHALHHDERSWGPDVEEYNPYRFEKPIPQGAYMPFSSGPRKCIGFEFSYIEVTMILATIFSKFTLSLDPALGKDYAPKPKTGLTRAADRVPLIFHPRASPAKWVKKTNEPKI
mmetsp:Transcript_2379/g.3458  ORF Transcript_2379/g.3458 Transcript_2379/m.3458 type:complete len:522 (+) Transcript_2379:67-1632(+)